MKATELYIPMVKNNYSPKWGRYLPLCTDTEVIFLRNDEKLECAKPRTIPGDK